MTREKETNVDKDEEESFEGILKDIGDFGLYQKILMLIFLFINVLLAYIVYSSLFLLYVPNHWCYTSSVSNNLTEEEIKVRTIPMDSHGNYKQCVMYNQSDTSNYNGTRPEIPCQYGWTYEQVEYFDSIITDLNWVCDDGWKGPFTQSMFFVGAAIGTLAFGYMSDNYGRSKVVLLSNAMLFLTGISITFSYDFLSFTILRFLMGLSFDTMMTSFYVLAMEYVSIKRRGMIGNLSFAVGFTFGGYVVLFIIWYTKNWRILFQILFAQAAIVIIIYKWIYESSRWLMTVNRHDEMLEIVLSISKINGKQISKDKMSLAVHTLKNQQFQNQMKLESKGKASFWNLLKSPRLRRIFIFATLTWMSCNILFDCHLRNLNSLKFSFYLSFLLSNSMELPADLLVVYFVDTLGRKFSLVFPLFLSGLSMLIAILFIQSEDSVFLIVLVCFGKFCATIAINVMMQMLIELFPTDIRSQSLAVSSVLSQFSLQLSPIIAYSSIYFGAAPFIMMGSGAILTAIFPIFLPETANRLLTNTVEEAEQFGKDQSWFEIPVLENWKRRREKIGAVNPNFHLD